MPHVQVIQPVSRQVQKLKVAAYARVSSDSFDQLNSFATQIEYYTSYIKANEEWEFAGLYADEAVSGTAVEKRTEFQRLMEDCRKGNVERILVKSISRFARNTLDCIGTVRELKQIGVSVLFEKENIDTAIMGSEMLLSILGSAAQEESLSISKNLKWSYRRRMRSGDFITCSAPLGYRLEKSNLVPDPQEVPIVEYIFSSYLAGKNMDEIAAELNAQERQFVRRKGSRWFRTSIRYILSNEKYIGDALVQKTYTPDELPLKNIPNKRQVSQYYISDSHPAIISRDVFRAVQQLLAKRAENHGRKEQKNKHPFSGKIQCGLCGAALHRHIKQNKILWCCYQHIRDKDACSLNAVSENDLQQVFLTGYNKLFDNRESIIKPMLKQLVELKERAVFANASVVALNDKITEIIRQNHTLTRLQSKGCIDSAIFIDRWNQNNQKLDELRVQLKRQQTPDAVEETLENTQILLNILEHSGGLLTFDSEIFRSVVCKIIVYPDRIQLRLINGLNLEEGRDLQ